MPGKRKAGKDIVQKALNRLGLKVSRDQEGVTVSNPKTGEKWRPKGHVSWQNTYCQTAADICARYLDDEDMRDNTIAFAQFSAKYMLARDGQVIYYSVFDVLGPDELHDMTTDKPKKGGYAGGYYTRFFAGVIAAGFSWTGEKHLLDSARKFWRNGSCADGKVLIFATHIKSNHDDVLLGARLFHH